MRYKIIANPLAGRGFGARSVPQIQSLLTGHGLDFDLVITKWAGEAIDLARQAVLDGYDTIVAAGGDGTVHEVVNGMMAAHGRAANSRTSSSRTANDNAAVVGNLGMLPTGSGCDFSSFAGVPADLEGACAKLAEGKTRVVDVGRFTVDNAEPCYFDNSVGIGFEGVVTVEVRRFHRLRGMALYLPAVLRSVFVSMQKAHSVIEYEQDDRENNPTWQRIELDVLMASIYNGARGGGAFMIAPQASLEDGKLDMCLVKNIPRIKMLYLIPFFMQGTHVRQKDVTMLRSRHVIITSADNLIAHSDGELICTEAHRIECELLPQRVRIIC